MPAVSRLRAAAHACWNRKRAEQAKAQSEEGMDSPSNSDSDFEMLESASPAAELTDIIADTDSSSDEVSMITITDNESEAEVSRKLVDG